MHITSSNSKLEIKAELGKQEKVLADKQRYIAANSHEWSWSQIQEQTAQCNRIKQRVGYLKSLLS